MKSGLTQREQQTLLLGGLLALVVLYIYSAYVLSPLLRESKRLGEQVMADTQKLQLLELTAANEGALREQHRQLQETVAALRAMLPSEQQLPAVIERLSDLAGQAGVKIQTIFPQRPGEGEDVPPGQAPKAHAPTGPVVYKDVMVQIDAVAGFHQLGAFLGMVESGEEPMQVSSLKIQADPKGVKRPQIRLVIRTFFSTEAGSAGTQAASAGGAS